MIQTSLTAYLLINSFNFIMGALMGIVIYKILKDMKKK